MIWLWVFSGILLLLALLCLTRVRVLGTVKNAEVTLDIRLGLLRFRVLPGSTKKKTAKPVKKKAEETASPKKRSFSRASLADGREVARVLWPPLKKALERTRRGVRVCPLNLSLTLGGLEDPAATAILYGRLQAVMWSIMPLLEEVLVIPDPHLHIGMDFNVAETRFEGVFGLSTRLGTLLRTGLGTALRVLRWFLRNRKKAQAKPVKSAAA